MIQATSKKLKNKYYAKKGDDLNSASEARDTKREFRLMRNHNVLKTRQVNAISQKN